MSDADRQYLRGYREQSAWLEGKSLAEARQALESRRATLAPDVYNDGGTQATIDSIARTAQG